MKRFRSLIALALALSLVVLSPGSSAYHAVAQTMGASVNGSAATGVTGVVGANLGRTTGVDAIAALSPSALTLSSVLAAPSLAPSALLNAAVLPAASAVSPRSVKAAMPAALQAIVPAAAKATTEPYGEEVSLPHAVGKGLETLKTNLSAASAAEKPAETQAAEARKQFDGEALKSDLSAPVAADVSVKSNAVALTAAKKDDKGMPDSGDAHDGTGRPVDNDGAIDDLGNPSRRGGEGGPDDRSDPDQSNRGGSGLFGNVALGLAGGGVAAAAVFTLGSLAIFPMIILSLVLHEIGHARMADRLGDPTSRLGTYEAIDWRRIGETRFESFRLIMPHKTVRADRGSLNPLTWGSHIDPFMTILVPIITFMTMGMMFGGARPVQFDDRYFKNPARDEALVSIAGPAVNAGLAIAGAFAITGALAAGLGAGVVAMLVSFVFLNVMLGLINLIPLPMFDGSRILKAFLPAAARDRVEAVFEWLGPMGALLPLMLLFWLAGGPILAGLVFVTKAIIGTALSVTGVQLASAFLPAVAALGLAVGQLGAAAPAAPAPPNNSGAAAGGGNAPVDLIVMFGEKKTTLHDAHISSVDVNLPSGVEQYTRLQQAMLAQLESAGLDSAALEPYKGTPLATYARINAATIRVDGAVAAEFTKQMVERGFAVYPNAERKIIRPVPVTPEQMDPAVRNAVTMDENLKITKADLVQAEAVKQWGKPDLGFWAGLWTKIFKSAPPQPKFGVIDSGADISHPLLKRVKEVKNMTSGENKDDIGHGSWVTSTVLHMAPWSKNTTHYKTFLNGSATLDDILKSLTQAGNDGNLVISNSWGDDEGDRDGPDAQLVKKLAQEGHIMVFAAGNAGSGKNTIGSPAIVTYKDPTTGAIRVVSVAAAGRDKKIAYFSSRGPGSPKTAKDPNYKDQRPDLTAVGYNIEGAWPAALGDADRTDGEKGPVKAISGTSMSTPGVAGALALLAMMFGVTEKGAKLDAIVNAVMATLEKTGQGPDNEGEGFLNLKAAYDRLVPTREAQARYRDLQNQYGGIERTISPFLDYRPGMLSDEAYGRQLSRMDGAIRDMAALRALYPGIDDLSRSEKQREALSSDVAAYKALQSRLSDLEYFRNMSGTWRYGVMVEAEMFSRVTTEIEQITGRLKAMESADSTLAYRAAGPIKRLILNATGAAPKP